MKDEEINTLKNTEERDWDNKIAELTRHVHKLETDMPMKNKKPHIEDAYKFIMEEAMLNTWQMKLSPLRRWISKTPATSNYQHFKFCGSP